MVPNLMLLGLGEKSWAVDGGGDWIDGGGLLWMARLILVIA